MSRHLGRHSFSWSSKGGKRRAVRPAVDWSDMSEKAVPAGVKPFLERLGEGVVVFDGAMGTMLYARGVFVNRCFDELNLSNPTMVRSVHEEYLAAGAEVVIPPPLPLRVHLPYFYYYFIRCAALLNLPSSTVKVKILTLY